MRILIVEDEGLVSLALEWTLKVAGHTILGPAGSVGEGIALTRAAAPDLALLDLDLRDGGNGLVVARHLRRCHGTPVLFVTAQVTQARAHRDLAWGLLRKPYITENLPRIVTFIDDLAHGRTLPRMPPQLEMFRPLPG